MVTVMTYYRFPENLLRRLRWDPDGCVRYTGRLDAHGYGVVRAGGPKALAHRAMYELMVEPIPPGAVLDHLCHNADAACPGGSTCPHRACVNVGHLAPVTKSENGRTARTGVRALTHCRHGHEYTVENTEYDTVSGYRRCRACRADARRRKAAS